MRQSALHTLTRPLAALCNRLFTALLIAPIRLYQWTLSPILGRQCKYHPTCSHYTIEALRVHGPVRGLMLGAKRIAACHPFAKGGFDPVPPRE